MTQWKKEFTLLCKYEVNIKITVKQVFFILAFYHFIEIFLSAIPNLITLDYFGHLAAFIVLIIAACNYGNESDIRNYRRRIFKIYAIIMLLLMGPFFIFRIVMVSTKTDTLTFGGRSDDTGGGSDDVEGDGDTGGESDENGSIAAWFAIVYGIRFAIWIMLLYLMCLYSDFRN